MLPSIARKMLSVMCFSVCVLQGVAHAQAPVLESQPEFDIGDKWTYQFTNLGDHKEPTQFIHQAYKSEEGSGWIYGESLDPSATRKSFIVRYDYKRGDIKEGFNFNPSKPKVPGRRYNNSLPADDRIQFPLTVGKEYKTREDWENGNGWNEYDIKVAAFEKVKVEAGEFDAYKIKLTGWWNRTDKGPTYRGKSEFVYWFAPAAKRVVKIEFYDQNSRGQLFNQTATELVKWEPKAPLAAALETPTAAPVVEAAK